MNPTNHTYTPSATALMADRDLESHGFFLAPLLQPGFEVLDAGCGPGTITTGIAETVFPGRVAAMDTCAQQLNHGRRLAEGREIVNVSFVAGSSQEIPFANESFDVVFAHDLLEHQRDPMLSLREFHRVTRPGGLIAVCSPDWDDFEFDPHPLRLRRAMNAYRSLQECNGGNTRAGAHLADWVTAAGFVPLMHDAWTEELRAQPIAEHLALQMDHAGQFHHAAALREWGGDPDARFRQVWKYATAVRADDIRRTGIFVE